MRRSRASLAVAGILAMPVFFAALMAMSLAVERPSVATRHGKTVLGDPTGSTEAKIWLLAVLPALVLVLVGTAAIRLGRAGVVATALASIAIVAALLIPIGTWQSRHAARFPVGVDLIPPSAGSGDIYLRGEWEARAKKTAEQIGGAAIGIAVIAILVTVGLALRRRRADVAPPPVELAAGGPPFV